MRNVTIFEFSKINSGASKEELNLFQGFQAMIQQFEYKFANNSTSDKNIKQILNVILNDIDTISKSNGVYIQLFDADMIFCGDQIYHAIYFAEKAFLLNNNISNNHAIEYLLYTSLQRQIKNALTLVGFNMGSESAGSKKERFSIIVSIAGKNIVNGPLIFGKISQLFENNFHVSQTTQKEVEFNPSKLEFLMQKYQIKEFNVLNALHLRGLSIENLKQDLKILDSSKLQDAIIDCLVERMVALSLDNGR